MTVIGDILFESLQSNNHSDKKKFLKKKLLFPSTILGSFLIIGGILIRFPEFLIRESFSWVIYSIGIILLIFSLLLLFEEFLFRNVKKSYQFLYYYSFYSLTIYLSHNLLYFIFFRRLNAYNVWIFIFCTFILLGLLFRAIYKKWEGKASIKVLVARMSLSITMQIEQRINNKNTETEF